MAVTKEQLSVVQTLLDLGANPWLKDPQGRTPVDLAAENEKVKTAFVEYYEEVDITDKNQDELVLLFVRLGMVSRLTAVLQSGANLKRTDEEGNSCLHIAAAQGSLDILEILLQGGADVAAKNQAGNTSVWLAMEHKHEAAVEVLLQAMIAAGMDIDAQIIGHMCVCVCVCVDVYVRIHLYTYAHTHILYIYRYIYVYIYKVPNAIPHLEKPVVPKP